jgi:hypothetical protein
MIGHNEEDRLLFLSLLFGKSIWMIGRNNDDPQKHLHNDKKATTKVSLPLYPPPPSFALTAHPHNAMMALYLPPLRAVSLLAALLVGAYGVSVGLAAPLASWAATRVLSLLEFWALVVGVCALLLWQIITCIYKHARRTLTSILAPQPRVADLPPERWALVAEHGDGLVDAWRLMRVCRAARAGAKEWLSTLPGLVVCGGCSSILGTGQESRDVWRLDLATLRWEPMPALVTARESHACCAVRGTLVVLGGRTTKGEGSQFSSKAEMLSSMAFVDLPPVSRGAINCAAAIEVNESDSAAGQVLLLGGEVRTEDDA